MRKELGIFSLGSGHVFALLKVSGGWSLDDKQEQSLCLGPRKYVRSEAETGED